jgi:signal transduction histidine kinase
MEPTTVDPDSGTSADLAARLRRVYVRTGFAAALWIVLSVACGYSLSKRFIRGEVAKAAEMAEESARETSGLVERLFHELAAIPQVLSSDKEMRELVGKYNALGNTFARLTQEQRRQRLLNDPQVLGVGKRLTELRGELGFDTLFVSTSSGMLFVGSDWDTDSSVPGLDISNRDYFKAAIAGRRGYMFAMARTTVPRPVFFFSSPIAEVTGVAGAVVTMQSSEAIGLLLAAGQQAVLIVDKQGMVVASSQREFYLRHVGPFANTKPDAGTLRTAYGQETLHVLDVARPARLYHNTEWTIDGRFYLVNQSGPERTYGYRLLVLTPTDWVAGVRRLHNIIGTLVLLVGSLLIALIGRRVANLARRDYEAEATAALNQKLRSVNETLTKVNAEKDRYLGIAAHDLRNPLSSMRALSEIMIETPLEADQQREFLDTIHRTSDEMLGLVNDLLDTSVIESGKLDLRRSEQDMAKLVQRRLRHLEPQARGKKIDLNVDLDCAGKASIDPARFGQVIDNLVSNAIKFSPAETTIHIALRSSGGTFSFSVQDQGPGIAEADRKLLFRSFQKLSARPTGGEKSTGLGLAIVKKIVDSHGGTIDVESPAEGGTRFLVTVPLTPTS